MLHNDVRDKGLEQISNSANWNGGTLTRVITKGEAASRTEATTLVPTGKRVSSEVSLSAGDLTLTDRAGGGRKVTVAQKTGTAAATTTAGDDLWWAIYDGSRLLATGQETTDQVLTNGNPCTLPAGDLVYIA